ncbi:MAG: hypothetical protein K6A23_04585 [Butyrivibrio sp.]|nr:hypothetical protein [Butyrivibrio sp.]
MNKTIRSYFFNLKKLQKPLETYLFPMILFILPFIGVNQGLDVTDTTYSLGNFQYQDILDPMWMLATYIPNVVGHFMLMLPGAGTMLGMNIYATLPICALALVTYYMLQRWMPGWMIFIGEVIAISLCWCPRVILYNYLTYLFFNFGAIALLYAVTAWKNQSFKYTVAGFLLGMNVMVRFPNLAEAALILVVWFYGYLSKKPFKDVVRETALCIAGYIIGIIIPFVSIIASYGFDGYIQSIQSLFSMSESASDYTFAGMILSVAKAYFSSLQNMLIMIPCMAAGVLMFMLKPEKYLWLKKILYMAGLLILVRFYLAEGVITRNYYYYDSMFEVAMMFVIVTIILTVLGIAGVLNGSIEERVISLAVLIIILITPLGSNNYTFPVINNLFVVAPLSLWLFRRTMQRFGENHINFPWQAMATMIIVVLVVQGSLFHINYSFVDGADGTARNTRVTNISKVSSMITTKENAQSLESLYTFLSDNNLLDNETIFYGTYSAGLAYVMDLKPALFSLWPDLDSNSVEKFEESLTDSMELIPTVIINNETVGEASGEAKYELLLDYMSVRHYNKVFENERYVVYISPEM